MTESLLTGEVSNSKVAAVFRDAEAARSAAREVVAALGLQPVQVQLLTPGEPFPGRKLEPESRGIWHTIVVAHLRLGVVGAVAGLLAFFALHAYGVAFIARSPVASALVLVSFGAVAGLMLGGLVSLRPDHDRYVEAARDAMAAGATTVVVHAYSGEEADAAGAFLRSRGGEVTTTL